MRTATLALCLALEVTSEVASAQGGNDPVADLRACSLMTERAERLECFEKLSHSIAPPAHPGPADESWTVSETTSPVNYTPIVVATTASRGGSNESSMQLAIYCRGGRTELVVAGPAVSRSGEQYSISYRINNGQPVLLAAASPSFGKGAAFKGDVIPLLQSLPEHGDVFIRLSTRTGAAQEGSFSLAGLKLVREKLAVACKWPHAGDKSRN